MLIWHIARRLRPPQSAGRALPRRQLYGPELRTLADYFERCDRLRAPLAPHVVGLLRAGVSVVLDFHANTIRQDDGCVRSSRRPRRPTNSISSMYPTRGAPPEDGVSDAEFDHVTSFFVPPAPGEAFNVVRHGDG